MKAPKIANSANKILINGGAKGHRELSCLDYVGD